MHVLIGAARTSLDTYYLRDRGGISYDFTEVFRKRAETYTIVDTSSATSSERGTRKCSSADLDIGCLLPENQIRLYPVQHAADSMPLEYRVDYLCCQRQHVHSIQWCIQEFRVNYSHVKCTVAGGGV